jgi:hypothetical protein
MGRVHDAVNLKGRRRCRQEVPWRLAWRAEPCRTHGNILAVRRRDPKRKVASEPCDDVRSEVNGRLDAR